MIIRLVRSVDSVDFSCLVVSDYRLTIVYEVPIVCGVTIFTHTYYSSAIVLYGGKKKKIEEKPLCDTPDKTRRAWVDLFDSVTCCAVAITASSGTTDSQSVFRLVVFFVHRVQSGPVRTRKIRVHDRFNTVILRCDVLGHGFRDDAHTIVISAGRVVSFDPTPNAAWSRY